VPAANPAAAMVRARFIRRGRWNGIAAVETVHRERWAFAGEESRRARRARSRTTSRAKLGKSEGGNLWHANGSNWHPAKEARGPDYRRRKQRSGDGKSAKEDLMPEETASANKAAGRTNRWAWPACRRAVADGRDLTALPDHESAKGYSIPSVRDDQ